MPVNYAEITESLSASRLRTYRTGLTTETSGLPTPEAVKAYFLLNDISQHFFVPLQLVEVVLRNRINGHVINHKGKTAWYDSVPATVKTKDQVIKAKDLAKEEVATPTPDDVVCRLTFGFWLTCSTAVTGMRHGPTITFGTSTGSRRSSRGQAASVSRSAWSAHGC